MWNIVCCFQVILFLFLFLVLSIPLISNKSDTCLYKWYITLHSGCGVFSCRISTVHERKLVVFS